MASPTDKVRSFFDSEALEYVRSREQQYSFQSQKNLVLELLGGAAGGTRGRALDLGCGPALMEEALLERGYEVWGIDASTQMIEYGNARLARHALRRRCHLSVGDIEHIACADGFYDAVISMGVLEYLPDYTPALREIHRVLQNGGVAVFTVPSRISAYYFSRIVYLSGTALVRRALRRQEPARAAPTMNRCVPWRLDRQLEQAGFRKLASRACNFIFFPLHERYPRASLALNRRLSPLAASPLGLLLGTQYVVKAQKKG